MQEARRWLQQLCDTYQMLLNVCGEGKSMNDGFDDYRDNLDDIVKKIFPPLDCSYLSEFSFQSGEPGIGGGINEKELILCTQFPRRYRNKVLDWFKESDYEDYTLAEINMGTWMLEIPVKHIVEILVGQEIASLRKECEEIAKPFLEKREAEILAKYEEKCLEEDPFYLGVRFVSYDGEYPTYCQGYLSLEIEGIPYKFYLPNLMGSIEYNLRNIKKESFPEHLQRYYNEIIRVTRQNLQCACCGGCS